MVDEELGGSPTYGIYKIYTENISETVTVKDRAGNEARQVINITFNNTIQTNPDINGDGKIDTGDVISLLRHIAQEKNSNIAIKRPTWKLSEIKLISGDLNKDGKIDSGDVVKLQRYIAAKSSLEIANKHQGWLEIY